MLLMILVGLAFGGYSNAMNETERDAVLDGHNALRSQVQPTAADMLQLEYEVKLEELADKWVNRCDYGFPARNEYPEYADLEMVTGRNETLDLVSMVQSWYSEHTNYDYNEGKCKSVCWHYLQVVWATTAKLGCAYKLCADMMMDSNRKFYFLVCLYEPPGGKLNQKPYQSGDPCSKCPSGYEECENNLCTKPEATQMLTSDYGESNNNVYSTSPSTLSTKPEATQVVTSDYGQAKNNAYNTSTRTTTTRTRTRTTPRTTRMPIGISTLGANSFSSKSLATTTRTTRRTSAPTTTEQTSPSKSSIISYVKATVFVMLLPLLLN